MSNIKITIEGCCSMTKKEIAKTIGFALKEKSFGKVVVTGEDYSNDYYKGMLKDESVEIVVVPDELQIRSGFRGDVDGVKRDRERYRVDLNEELIQTT